MCAVKGLGFREIKEGASLPECRLKMDRETYLAYNRLVGEINPLHFDREYAISLGFKDIVVAGVYTFSFIPKMIEAWVEEPAKICSIEITYQNPIYIEGTIVHKAHVRKKIEQDNRRYIEFDVSVADLEGNQTTSAVVTVDFS